MKISIILTLFLLNVLNCFSQSLIWSEDFQSYTNGTQNATKWTTNAGHCDGDATLGTANGNYWGVFNGEFRINDIEGLTCCQTGSSGEGNNNNLFLTENIDISTYTEISIAISLRAFDSNNDPFECTACGTGLDRLRAQYRIDGGVWVTFAEMCGVSAQYFSIECVDIQNGQNLRIRVLGGNQANSENYYFDNIYVYNATCSVALPVELISFSGRYNKDENANEILWSTASESNNERFEIYKSSNGYNWDLIEAQKGSGNSATQIDYQFYDYNIESGLVYYKLDQVDYDGKRTEHGIISIDNTDETVVMIKYYNLMGQEIGLDELFGFIIKETHFRSGQVGRELKLFY